MELLYEGYQPLPGGWRCTVGMLVLGNDPHHRNGVSGVLRLVGRRLRNYKIKAICVSIPRLRMRPYVNYVGYHDSLGYYLPRSKTREILRSVGRTSTIVVNTPYC